MDDVVDAFLAAAVTPGAEGASLDIGSGELVPAYAKSSLAYGASSAETSSPSFGAFPDRRLERVRVADPATAAAASGWRLRTYLGEGLARTVDFYPPSYGLWWKVGYLRLAESGHRADRVLEVLDDYGVRAL